MALDGPRPQRVSARFRLVLTVPAVPVGTMEDGGSTGIIIVMTIISMIIIISIVIIEIIEIDRNDNDK